MSFFSTLIIIILLIWLFHIVLKENFSSKKEKANVLFAWYDKNKKKATYSNYKKDIMGSDVVEYTAIKNGAPKSPKELYNLI